jgi:hypothetical protein
MEVCMPVFHVTYDIVTPESAEEGCTAENGFVHPNGGRDAIEVVDKMSDYDMDLRTAMRHCCPAEDTGGGWFSGYPETINYATGEEMTTALHPPRTITPASFQRLKRLLKIK